MLYNYFDFARDSRLQWICNQPCYSRLKRELLRSLQSHYFFSLTASSADGKDTASVRHHLYKYDDGATWWELQRLMIGYLNDRRDRAWRRCQVIKENKLTWEVFCLACLDLQSMVEKSRAMVRATRVDDVSDVLCRNQKIRDVLTISTLGLLIVQICWTILKKRSWANGAGGPYSMHTSPTVCDWARTSMTSWRGCLTKVL